MSFNDSFNPSKCKIIQETCTNEYKYAIFSDQQDQRLYYQIIFNTKCKSEQEKQCFSRNISKFSQISDFPVLLHIIDFNIDPFPSIIAEYLPNGTLSDTLNNSSHPNRQNFNGTKKLINLLGISLSLQFIYLNDINFGYLKSSNIYLDENMYPHLIFYEKSLQINDSKNSVKKIRAQSSDIHSFGLIAYELITGASCPNEESLDLSVIESEWMQTFLQNCLLDDCYEKHKYYLIYKLLLSNLSLYESIFGEVDAAEVVRYIELINDGYLHFLRKIKEKIESDDISAMIVYGNMLYQGIGVQEDKREASRFFKVAADRGDSEAMFRYGVMISNGDGIEKNTKEAARYYKMSADLGNPDSMNNYALLLENGDGIEKNIDEASLFYKKAADLGITISMCNYAIVRKSGDDNSKKEAARYFKMAADLGNRQGMYNYGMMLFDGRGIEKCQDEGLMFIKKAADKGYVIAMLKYGILRYQNDGDNRDMEEIGRYFKRAADFGNCHAMYVYGVMLNNGEGIKMNKLEAARYFKKAGYRGHDKAWRIYNQTTHYLNFAS